MWTIQSMSEMSNPHDKELVFMQLPKYEPGQWVFVILLIGSLALASASCVGDDCTLVHYCSGGYVMQDYGEAYCSPGTEPVLTLSECMEAKEACCSGDSGEVSEETYDGPKGCGVQYHPGGGGAEASVQFNDAPVSKGEEGHSPVCKLTSGVPTGAEITQFHECWTPPPIVLLVVLATTSSQRSISIWILSTCSSL